MSRVKMELGRMEPFVGGFEAHLLLSGYTPATTKNALKDVGRLGRWMADVEVEATDLNATTVGAFLMFLRASGARRIPGPRALRPLLDCLTTQGILSEDPAPLTPLDELIADYRAWLVDDRGLAGPTVLRYETLARRFLQERPGGGVTPTEGLSGVDVTAFLLRETERVSVGSAKGRVAELRSLLRYLHLKDLTPTSLASAVPPVAGWRDTTLPKGVSAPDVERILASCDRSDPGGCRDFAMLSLVARLGLRSIEVARIELGDIDWRAGEIVVRGKARRRDRLPLPWDVGEALSAYLHDVRRSTPARAVFLALKAPVRGIRPDLVSDVTRRACMRAGLPEVGAHRLRHALATEMLRRGAKLAEVSQVLRHRDVATTAIYAKVDIGRLRQVAQPWPGAQR
jgi:site-specific recombinase XerD